MKDGELVVVGIFSIFVIALTVSFFAIYNSFVAVTLWEWFVVPLGMRPIGMAHMCGIFTIISLLFKGHKTVYKDHEEDNVNFWLQALIGPPMALLFGFIYKSLM